jgi:hypothetical protein
MIAHVRGQGIRCAVPTELSFGKVRSCGPALLRLVLENEGKNKIAQSSGEDFFPMCGKMCNNTIKCLN